MWNRKILKVLEGFWGHKREVGGYIHNSGEIEIAENPKEHKVRLTNMVENEAKTEEERMKALEGWMTFYTHPREFPIPDILECYIAHIRASPVFVITKGLYEVRPKVVIPVADLVEIDNAAWKLAKQIFDFKAKILQIDSPRRPGLPFENLELLWQDLLFKLLPSVDIIPITKKIPAQLFYVR